MKSVLGLIEFKLEEAFSYHVSINVDGKFPRPLGPDGGTGFALGSFPKLIDETDTVDGKFP